MYIQPLTVLTLYLFMLILKRQPFMPNHCYFFLILSVKILLKLTLTYNVKIIRHMQLLTEISTRFILYVFRIMKYSIKTTYFKIFILRYCKNTSWFISSEYYIVENKRLYFVSKVVINMIEFFSIKLWKFISFIIWFKCQVIMAYHYF